MNKSHENYSRGEFAGQTAVFYCPHCQQPPQTKEGETAVKRPHAVCTDVETEMAMIKIVASVKSIFEK